MSHKRHNKKQLKLPSLSPTKKKYKSTPTLTKKKRNSRHHGTASCSKLPRNLKHGQKSSKLEKPKTSNPIKQRFLNISSSDAHLLHKDS